MKHLFLCEWRRFRVRAFVAAGIHGLALLLLSRVTNPLELHFQDHGPLLGLYMLFGLLFALVQIGGYRKPSQWLWLIHRPLPPAQIFAALAAAALAALALVIVLPLLLLVLAYDALTTHVVDTRHYVALLHVLAFTAMAWLAGAHASVSRHRLTVTILIAPLLFALHLASVWWLLLPVLACLAWLGWITLHAFRADREAPIRSHGVLLATALPLQLAFLLLLFHLGKGIVDGAAYLARPPLAVDVKKATAEDLENGLLTVEAEQGSDMLRRGLADSTDPRAASWRSQLPLLQKASLFPQVDRFPVRHQISNQPLGWWDEKRGIEWTFSHDRMMFHGRDPRSGEERGWWGANGAAAPVPFERIPLQGLSVDRWYAIDAEAQLQHEWFRLPAGERFISRPERGLGRWLVLTSGRVLAFREDRSVSDEHAPPRLDWQLALPGGADHLASVDVAELLDGWLVSFFYFDPYERFFEPWQRVVHVDEAGVATVVGERREVRDIGITTGAESTSALPMESWWLSPLLHVVARWPVTLLERGLTRPPPFDPLPEVRGFYPLAAALMLLSLGLAFAWLRGTRTGVGRRRIWLVSCAMLGLPALLSLVCLEPRAERR